MQKIMKMFVCSLLSASRRLVLAALFICFTISSYAQVGDLFVGAQGGFNTRYSDGMYGLNISYHLVDPIEVSFTGLLNPNISLTDELDHSVEKLNVYSLNLDMRYYMLLMRSWGMGPALGYQHLIVKNKDVPIGDFSASGFNIGWHMRFNITDELKITSGWRYTMAAEDARHHYIYLGIGYTFSLY
jgi:opacity protein-like surface antigen